MSRTVGLSDLPHIVVVAGVVRDPAGRILIAQRPPGRHLAGGWEFPGGKLHAGESDAAALARELREELGITVRACRHFMTATHDYPDRRVELRLRAVTDWTGDLRALDGQALRWAMPEELSQVDILDADRPFVAALQAGAVVESAGGRSMTQAALMQGERLEVRNPRSGVVDYWFTAPSIEQLVALATDLRAAQKDWVAQPLAARIAVLQRFKAELQARRERIVEQLSVDTGRYALAAGEFSAVLGVIDRWSRMAPELALPTEGQSIANPAISYRSQFVPYALVGIISPWNFPLTLALIDAVPALIAGCAVLLKPSEVTPRFVEPVREAIEAVPELARVLAMWPAGPVVGEQVVALSDVVCFTGSVRTGRRVAENAARHFIPAFLELGGNDPVIVTASADLDRAADIVLRASVLATGQACQSLERVYVDRKVCAPFVDKLVARARQVEPNWPDIHQGTIGPFIFARQADIVAEQIADAVAKGARVLTGGRIEDHGGKWLRPTVLVDVDHRMSIMTDETFGPVMPVMAYDTVEQAIALANEGVYGLSAAVIAGTLAEAEAIGERIDAGGISLNDGSMTGFMYEAEKHSFKLSGMGGSRMGPAGYLRFFRKKALIRQNGTPFTLDAVSESAAAPGAGR